MQLKHIFIALLALPLLSSCYYDNEEELYPPGSGAPCDTTITTYATVVAPIIEQKCVSCHNAGFAPGGVSLDNYAGVKVVADNQKLMGAINHTSAYPMPKGGPKLPPCDIAKIQRWVNNGSQNN